MCTLKTRKYDVMAFRYRPFAKMIWLGFFIVQNAYCSRDVFLQ